MMPEFRSDCTIHLHLEARGQPAKYAWVCRVSGEKARPLLLARGFLGMRPRGEAEAHALRFALRQAQRLLSEKLELSTSFPLQLEASPPGKRQINLGEAEILELWLGFRLRRLVKMRPAEMAELREEAQLAFAR